MRFLPLVVTVGNALVFPYYIIWLRNVTLTFPMFAWMFALHSFAAAFGYQICVKKPSKSIYWIYVVYAGSFIFVGLSAFWSFDYMYATVAIQIVLGFTQGYFRAWHIMQPFYKLHAVSNYLLVGFAMLGISFIQIITPQLILLVFGVLLFICFLYAFLKRNQTVNIEESHQD